MGACVEGAVNFSFERRGSKWFAPALRGPLISALREGVQNGFLSSLLGLWCQSGI